MIRIRAMLSSVVTVAMLVTGFGAATVSMAQEDANAPAEPLSEECKAFAADPGADVGDIMRAGCKPTIGQMAALMDNPLGNVAMLFTQADWYVKKDPVSGREDMQGNYMGIAQFPKKLTDNWNLINRVIWNVGSVPLDEEANNLLGATPGDGQLIPPTDGLVGTGEIVRCVECLGMVWT